MPAKSRGSRKCALTTAGRPPVCNACHVARGYRHLRPPKLLGNCARIRNRHSPRTWRAAAHYPALDRPARTPPHGDWSRRRPAGGMGCGRNSRKAGLRRSSEESRDHVCSCCCSYAACGCRCGNTGLARRASGCRAAVPSRLEAFAPTAPQSGKPRMAPVPPAFYAMPGGRLTIGRRFSTCPTKKEWMIGEGGNG